MIQSQEQKRATVSRSLLPPSRPQILRTNYQTEVNMNSMTVCLAVGAISFVRCEFSSNPKTPLQPWHYNHIYAGEWRTRGNPFNETGGSDSSPADDPDGPSHQKSDLLRDFLRLKRFYDECKTKVNKTLRKFVKTKVNRPLPELKAYVSSLYQCVKVYAFRAVDQMLQDDFIPLTDYAYFVRDGLNATHRLREGRASAREPPPPLKDYAPYVLSRHWTTLLHDRIATLLRTHSLKFRFDGTPISQGRSRRRDHRMFAMLVMGFMLMAGILVPMGFQFLTVLGGKSLLLAKMALIMSAINGLKKIATSNVGYGFYHTGADAHHHDHLHHGFHEKHLQLGPQNYNHLQSYN